MNANVVADIYDVLIAVLSKGEVIYFGNTCSCNCSEYK